MLQNLVQKDNLEENACLSNYMKIIDSKCTFLMYLLDCSVRIKKAALKELVCLSLRRVSCKCCLSLFCSYFIKAIITVLQSIFTSGVPFKDGVVPSLLLIFLL